MGCCVQQENRQAVVVSSKGESATVRVLPMSACTGNHKGCPWGDVMKQSAPGSFEVEALNTAGAAEGDTVEIEVGTRDYFKALFLVFILPILGIVTGYLAGNWIGFIAGMPERAGLFGGILSFIGFLTAFIFMIQMGKKYRPSYRIMKVISRTDKQASL